MIILMRKSIPELIFRFDVFIVNIWIFLCHSPNKILGKLCKWKLQFSTCFIIKTTIIWNDFCHKKIRWDTLILHHYWSQFFSPKKSFKIFVNEVVESINYALKDLKDWWMFCIFWMPIDLSFSNNRLRNCMKNRSTIRYVSYASFL